MRKVAGIDDCALPRDGQLVIERRHQLDNTIYAYTCCECKQSWKVYQNQYHSLTCSQRS